MDKVPCISSWTCRKILKLRDAARPYIQHKREGDSLFLCHDSWQSGWASISKIWTKINIYEAASSFDAKISSDIKDGQWRWKPVRSEDLMLVQSKLFQVENKNRDSVHWKLSKFNKFYCALAWEDIRAKQPSCSMMELCVIP